MKLGTQHTHAEQVPTIPQTQMMLYSYVRISKLVMRMTSIRGDDVNSPSTDKRCHVTSPGIGSDSHEVM